MLENKRWIEFGTERSPTKWRRRGFPEFFESEKIVVMRSPGKVPRAFIDDDNGIFNESAIGFVRWIDLKGVENKSLNKSYADMEKRIEFEKISSSLDLQYLLAIMNSRLIKYELNADRRSNIHIYPDDWRKIQIVPASLVMQKPFIDSTEAITDNTVSLESKRLSFTNYIESQWQLGLLSKKLQNWYELDFGVFIKELNKAIKKAGNEKLSKIDEMEWMEVFEAKKSKAQDLKNQIDKLDSDIDHMVYELYGLTKQEINIIEEA